VNLLKPPFPKHKASEKQSGEKISVAKHHTQQGSNKGANPDENSFQTQLQELLKQQKYRQALEEIKKIQRSHPKIEFSPKESEIWWLRGQQEFQKQDFKQAEKSFSRSLELGLTGEVYYWQAKCLLKLNQLDTAINLLKDAFAQDKLPKEYSVCYLKLLLLKGDTATVEHLITQNSKKFSTPQLHWVHGVLALKQGQYHTALTQFGKIKRPITPGDVPTAWMVYTQQVAGNWQGAAYFLGLPPAVGQPKYLGNPILEQLATFQLAQTGEFNLEQHRRDKATQEIMMVLRMCQLINQGNYSEAAHILMRFERRPLRFPELETLRSSLLALAGQQAMTTGDIECAEKFWQPLQTEQPFNPQLAVNLLSVLRANDSDQEHQRLITRILKWLEEQGRKNPQEWPEERLKPTQAHLLCLMADTYMGMDRDRQAMASIRQAEEICPTSPELIGRKGLIAASDNELPEATALLTQALESGCRYPEVYGVLLSCWELLDNKQARNEARQRFGKTFGDINIEPEIEVLPWVDALSSQSYSFFIRLIQEGKPKDPATRACQIFVDAAEGVPNSGGRVSLNQTQAAQIWDNLLSKLPGQDQIPVLQAIAISIQLFAKREKGIAALINKYSEQLFRLITDYPEAKVAHLVVLALKEGNNSKKLESPIEMYLNTTPQPGNALANIQLQARRFGVIQSLVPALEAALEREPQNPLLLLARATTYPVTSSNYEKLKQQGFELARRLQDAKALQAFREEQAFTTAQEAREMMPDPEEFDNMRGLDIDDFIEAMIKRLFGDKIPPSELKRMLPELKQRMLSEMPDFSEEEEEDDYIDLSSIFGRMPPNTKKKKGRTRGGFSELF